jgi:choline dehydrogenase
VVKPNYLQSETDLQVLEYGVKLSREIAATKAFKDFTIAEAAPGTDKDPAALREYIRTHCSTVWHVAGTCKMGRDRMGVVDPQLRVHGVEGLRVADASIMPEVVAGNTHAACVMIGERVSDFVLGRPAV